MGRRAVVFSVLVATSVYALGTAAIPPADRKAWTVVARRHVPPNSQLLAIHARNDHDVWAVGQNVHGSPSQQSGLTLHWDGKHWSAPLAAAGAVRLAGVTSGPGGIWSVGDQDGAPFAPPWSGTFSGGAWHAKKVKVTEGDLPAITTDPAGHVDAVGSQYLGGGGAGSAVALVLTRSPPSGSSRRGWRTSDARPGTRPETI